VITDKIVGRYICLPCESLRVLPRTERKKVSTRAEATGTRDELENAAMFCYAVSDVPLPVSDPVFIDR
jgi:hypothetical protein